MAEKAAEAAAADAQVIKISVLSSSEYSSNAFLLRGGGVHWNAESSSISMPDEAFVVGGGGGGSDWPVAEGVVESAFFLAATMVARVE